MKSLGICLGSSNISMVLLERKNKEIIEITRKIVPHDGNPRVVVEEIVGNDDREHRVPQKLQALIIFQRIWIFVEIGSMSKRPAE